MQALIVPFFLLILNIVVVDILIWINFSLLQKDWTEMAGKGSKIVNPDCTPVPYSKTGYNSFEEFYPFYLGEHHNQICRRLHIVGTTNSILIVLMALITGYYPLAILALPQAYTLAWIGHFVFEKNKPATFDHPIYSVRVSI